MKVAGTFRHFFFPNMPQNNSNSSCHCQQATVTTLVVRLHEVTERKRGFKKIIFLHLPYRHFFALVC
jgi:hypothetical protein